MGATTFVAFALGNTVKEAFKEAHDQATYDYGHSGYTGTIAEKLGVISFGQVSSFNVDKLDTFYDRYGAWLGDTRQNRPMVPRGIPSSVLDQIQQSYETYNDKWGPAVAFEVTGKRAIELKRAFGNPRTHKKVWVFLGWAPQ